MSKFSLAFLLHVGIEVFQTLPFLAMSACGRRRLRIEDAS